MASQAARPYVGTPVEELFNGLAEPAPSTFAEPYPDTAGPR
jgi:hypothetical protein